jgi:hypothetical protein
MAGERGAFYDVAAAEIAGELHLCGATTDGHLWHTVRHRDGSWLPFADVEATAAGEHGAFNAITTVGAPNRHSQLYGELRAGLLSRGFALSRYFRVNLLSDTNMLEMSDGAPWLLAQDATTQQFYRWHVAEHSRGNTLMITGQLMACLAVEHALGSPDARNIIMAALQSLASLYKFSQFSGSHFEGYIVRGDPVTSDQWVLDAQGRLQYCNWPIAADGTYLFCTPLDDPRYLRQLSNFQKSTMSQAEQDAYNTARWYSAMFFRWFEPSMDELVGLIAGYDMVFRLVTDQQIRDEVRRQVTNLADYLAQHGYLLVRPTGGFAAEGGTGALPAFEFPFNQVFPRIAGQSFPSRVDFVGACQQADVWNCISTGFNWATIAGIAVSAAAQVLDPVLIVLGLVTTQFTTLVTAVDLARVAALLQCRDCFDVFYDNQAQEVAVAYLFKLVPPPQRFGLWMMGMEYSTGCTGNFPPFIGLTGLDDSDTLVKNSYLSWLPARRAHPELEQNCSTSLGAQTAWASAVGVLLGAGTTEEQTLATLLQQRYDNFHGPGSSRSAQGGQQWFGQDNLSVLDKLPVPDDPRMYDEMLSALEYMSAVALAWLHAQRRARAGTPVTAPGFPELPDLQLWPRVTVPKDVVQAAQHPDPGWPMVVPVAAIQGTATPQVDADGANLFLAGGTPAKSPVPAPILPPPSSNLRFDQTITVHESDGDVYTGVTLRNGEDFAVQAAGSIWAGVPLTGSNGPQGWTNIEYDTKFPLHGVPSAHPYALLGKLQNYFFIGSGIPRTRYIYQESCPLRLRINDDTPGNGNGSFSCRVQVWGPPLPQPPVLAVSVQPAPIAIGTPVQVTVHVEDGNTHARVAATVTVRNPDSQGNMVTTTHASDTPFTETFHRVRVKRFDPDTRTYYWETVEPDGTVSALGYPAQIIPFDFS